MDIKPHGRSVPKLALLIESTRTYTRKILAGVRRYISAGGPWSTFLELLALDSTPPQWIPKWDGNGILTGFYSSAMSELIEATGLPAVELRSTHFSGRRPFVGMNSAETGRPAAEHLLHQSYRDIAVSGFLSERFFDERVRSFISTAHSRANRCNQLLEEVSDSTQDWEGGRAAGRSIDINCERDRHYQKGKENGKYAHQRARREHRTHEIRKSGRIENPLHRPLAPETRRARSWPLPPQSPTPCVKLALPHTAATPPFPLAHRFPHTRAPAGFPTPLLCSKRCPKH